MDRIEVRGRISVKRPAFGDVEFEGETRRFHENLRGLSVRYRNLARSSKSPRIEVLRAELPYRRAQMRRLLNDISLIHLLTEQCEMELAELEALEAERRPNAGAA